MKNNVDELINKYLDNELNENELAQFNLLLEDKDVLAKVKAAQMLDRNLKLITIAETPSLSTQAIMKNISLHANAKRSNWFFWMVVSLFLSGIGAFTYLALESYKPDENTIKNSTVFTALREFVAEKSETTSAILANADFKLVALIATLLMLVIGYFVFENHLNFKNKLKSL